MFKQEILLALILKPYKQITEKKMHISIITLIALIFGTSLFSLFIFSFLVASKRGDEEMMEAIKIDDEISLLNKKRLK